MPGKISFRARDAVKCPVCGFEYKREELLTGGGRMNAGEVTDELHRIYLPTLRYGRVYPLIYSISVCPGCLYSAFPRHFLKIGDDEIEKMQENRHERQALMDRIFANPDFGQDRDLNLGIASCVLAAQSYEHRTRECSPTFLQGLCFLRAGWLARELDQNKSGENYDQMARIFLRKASFLYSRCLEEQREGRERLEDVTHHGPDQDNNFGFDGVLYISAVLLFKYGPREPVDKRVEILKEARRVISRVVGMGKSSKGKPSVIVERGRNIHEVITSELHSLE